MYIPFIKFGPYAPYEHNLETSCHKIEEPYCKTPKLYHERCEKYMQYVFEKYVKFVSNI